ncbi:MAG: spheroidene monooxygenase [Acidimicrobiales bacterium]
MAIVASFHLTRYPAHHALTVMTGLVTRRRALAATPGLRFARQLGTGRGASMALGADLRRWATFAVWEGEDALDTFLTTSPIACGWRQHGHETWSVRLAPMSAHGTWGGADPFARAGPATASRAADATDSEAGTGTADADAGVGGDAGTEAGTDLDAGGEGDQPVAVLTRARIPVRHWAAFYRSVSAVEDHLRRQAGLLAVVGIGEAPVGLQATFSLWRSTAAMDAFAYRSSPHAAVVRRTRAAGWFGEELFARFRPYGSTGTWDGADPLALAGAGRRAGGNGS